MDRRIKIAKKFVERNFAKPLKVKDLARRLRLTPLHFGRLFKKEAGQSFKHFVLACRMKRARSLMLLDPSLAIKDVAWQVGYSYEHLCVFTRDFEKYWGYPPSECRKAAA